jgi:thymidylate kinase
MLQRYMNLEDEFRFITVDANEPIETQQSFVRQTVAARLNLPTFARNQVKAS